MFGMGRDGTVPRGLGRVNPRFRTPVAGLVVMGVIPVIALIMYLASASLQKTIVYIDSTGGLLFAGYYVVISLYSIWYYRTVLFRDAREFVMGLLLPLVGAGTLVYVIIKSMPGTATPVKGNTFAADPPAGNSSTRLLSVSVTYTLPAGSTATPSGFFRPVNGSTV